MARPELRTLLRHIHHLAGPCAAAEDSDRVLLQRFAARREEAAFAALVQRHGTLVLNVCRRLLRQEQDAEDVFQATFLLLARKAGSVRWRDTVAPWLHAVAHRLALKARTRAVRRRREEQRVAELRSTTTAEDLSWREAVGILEEELGRLPDRYRAPLLLCCWDGKTRDEAAQLLGWTVGSLKGRLERGRELLRRRLVRRGVALSAGLLAAGLARGGVPAALADATVRLALGAVSGAAGIVPPAVAALADAALSAAKAKVAGVLLIVALLGASAGIWTHQARTPRPVQEAQAEETPLPPGERAEGERLAMALPAPPEKAQEPKPPEETPAAEKPPTPLPWPRADRDGDPLPAGVVQRFGTARLRHADVVQLAAFSPDGKMLATADGSSSWVHLWDTTTGKELHRFPIQATSLAFSPGGEMLAAWGGSQAPARKWGARIWNTKTGTLWKEETGNGSPKAGLLTFSADGTRLWAVGPNAVAVWETGGRARFVPAKQLIVREGPATAVTVGRGPADQFLAIAEGTRINYSLDDVNRKPLGALMSGGAEFTALTGADNVLAAGTADGAIHLWEVKGGALPTPLRDWHGPKEAVAALAMSRSGLEFRLTSVSVSADVAVRVWDPKSAKELSKCTLDGLPKMTPRPGDRPHFVLSPDGKCVTVVGLSQRVRLWDTGTGKELFAPNGHERAVRGVAFQPDGKTVTSVTGDGVLLWSAGSDDPPRRVVGPGLGASVVAVSRDGKAVAASTAPGRVDVWDSASEKVVQQIKMGVRVMGLTFGPETVLSLCFAPDGKALAFGTTEGARLVSLPEGTPRRLGEEKVPTTALAFSPDGRLLATDTGLGLALWDVATGKRVRTLAARPAGGVHPLTFDPEGRTLAAADLLEGVVLYDVATGGELRRCGRDAAPIHSLAFARAGRLLVGGDGDGLRVWETASGSEVLRLTGHTGAVNSVAVSPDGNRLVTGGADTTVLLWDLAAAWKETANWPKGKAPPRSEELWRDLAGDGVAAYRAVWALAAERDSALTFIKKDLVEPKDDPSRDEVQRLLTDLDAADPKVRDRAIRGLRRLGARAELALRKALEGARSDKLRARLRGLLAELEGDDPLKPERDVRHAARVVDLLEMIGTAEARKSLETLARDGRTGALQEEARAVLGRWPAGARPAP